MLRLTQKRSSPPAATEGWLERLFHEGRPGARHADDQQRRLVAHAKRLARGKENPGAVAGHQPIDMLGEFRPVEPRGPPLDRVGLIEMLHRLSVFSQIVEHLGDREMVECPVGIADAGAASAASIRSRRGRSASVHFFAGPRRDAR